MFDFFSRKKKRARAFSPRAEIAQLAQLSPPSTLVYLPKPGRPDDDPEELGKSFFLVRDKKIYTEGASLYITTPDNLKTGATDHTLNNSIVSLQFFSRRIPHRVECRIIGRFRLLPEIVETLDFPAKSAYKLQPIGKIYKQDKRQHYRYQTKNYGDSRIPLTTHITFEAFAKATNHEFPSDGAPPIRLTDLAPRAHASSERQRTFTTRDSINEFRDLMLDKQPHDRFVQVTRVVKDKSAGGVSRKGDEILLGDINILGLEMESLRDVLYLKKSKKTTTATRGAQADQYKLQVGEKILARFGHKGTHYEMLWEVMEARTQNEVVRPLGYMRPESGLEVGVINYSIGGVLIESSPEFLRLVLGDECPPNVAEEADFSGDYWRKAFDMMRIPMIHFTLYPEVRFPDNVKSYEPELPAKFSIVGQVVRTHVANVKGRQILQHGVWFAFDPEDIPLEEDELVNWRYSRMSRDNAHLRVTHTSLSLLIGHLENRAKEMRITAPRA